MSQKRPLENCAVSVIGVDVPDQEKRIIRIIEELGGTYSPRVTNDVFCVLVKRVGSQHNAIQKYKIPCVDLQWLWDCRSYRRRVSFDQYYAKPFIGLSVSCTGYTNEERNHIQNCVIENGGEFGSKMSRETCTHLITEEEDPSPTSKYAYAKLWRTVQIVTMKWLTDCNKQKSWISEYEYLVSTAAAEAQIEKKRLKDRKSGNFKPGSSTVSASKTSIENQSTDTHKTLEDINQSNGIGNPDNTKKRKLNDVVYVPTVADFPSYKLLDHSKCKNLLNQETFFIDGFTPEIRDYLVRLVLFAGGRRHHVLNLNVTRIILGNHVDERLVAAARLHPLGVPCVTISWLIEKIFATIDISKMEEKKVS